MSQAKSEAEAASSEVLDVKLKAESDLAALRKQLAQSQAALATAEQVQIPPLIWLRTLRGSLTGESSLEGDSRVRKLSRTYSHSCSRIGKFVTVQVQ